MDLKGKTGTSQGSLLPALSFGCVSLWKDVGEEESAAMFWCLGPVKASSWPQVYGRGNEGAEGSSVSSFA